MPNEPKPTPRKPGRKTLAGVVGALCASLLLVAIPREESGRTVDVSIAASGEASVRHVAGRQYLTAYLDIVGVPTACDGITKGIKLGQRYTEAQCAELLEGELIEHAEGVQRCVPELWQRGRDYQRFAAVSLAYNIGVAGFCRSTAARRFRAGAWAEGCAAIPLWNRAGGVVVRGLVLRRERERQACLTGLVPGLTAATLSARMGRVR